MAQTQPAAVTGDGGNSTITNQDEKTILDRFVSNVPVQTVGYQADDSHITPQFREQSI